MAKGSSDSSGAVTGKSGPVGKGFAGGNNSPAAQVIAKGGRSSAVVRSGLAETNDAAAKLMARGGSGRGATGTSRATVSRGLGGATASKAALSGRRVARSARA